MYASWSLCRSRSNPLPVSLPQECRKATKLFAAFANPEKGLDTIIPASILRKAKGFAFLTVAKAGFIFSARAGSGVVIARLQDGSWSAPSAIGTAGGGVGFQAGVEMAEFLIILNSRAAVASFMAAGSLTIGGNMSVAAGPLGRNVEGTGSVSTKGKVSAMYSYSRTKGLFGGASIEGSVIVERSDANAKAYGYDVTAKQLLSGQVEVPPFAEVLIDTIARRTGTGGDWLQDDDEDFRPDPQSGYAFATQFASGSSRGDSPTRDRKSRLGALGGIGRSRSSSTSLNDASQGRQDALVGGDTFGFGGGGPLTSSKPMFEHQFTDETSTDTWRSGSGAAMGKTGSAKLTKSRSSNGYRAGDSNRSLNEPQWGAEAAPTATRDSFDSLDDQYGSYGPISGESSEDDYKNADINASANESKMGRFRSSTVGQSSARPSLLSRARSASSPFTSFRGSSKNSPRDSRAASPSPFDDSTGFVAKTNPTKPWDSEDEDFLNENSHRPQYTPSAITPKAGHRGDPFDFREVGSSLAQSIGNGSAVSSSSAPNGTRSRSNTVGKGIGKAIALYDFAGVESGDLPFRKGDTITILARDDEEWWKGRVGMREGIFPRNYVEADFDP
ncbi:hypothetical protein OIO90_005359 [Microbotryomycetes sp. JL221]|nr:hypothetical protein OIO90_005359 [Microbotryomycetes sp. JL221]